MNASNQTESSRQDASSTAVDNRPIRVAVCGGLGKMGREVVKTIARDPELELAGVIDRNARNESVSEVFDLPHESSMRLEKNLAEMLEQAKPDVCVDFTHPDAVFDNVMTLIGAGVRPVVGTTGLHAEQLSLIDEALKSRNLGGMVVPNFAIGGVLMMKFAQEAAKYFEHAEIIELHHNKKADAPSGTAIKTAELMHQSRSRFGITNAPEKEVIPGSRGGGGPADIRIHSVRLPGFIAHQEVILGGPGEILTLRHDSMDRSCFMPGVALAVKKVMELHGLVYGLEHIL